MTRRIGDWHLLGHGDDPVPATQWDVDQVAKDYADRAGDLGEAADVLDLLSKLDGWTGEAAVVFADSAHDIVEDLRDAEERYDAAAEALGTYAVAVDTARTRSWTALGDAESAESTRQANAVDTLAGVEEATAQQRAQQQDSDDRHDAAVTALACARRDLQDALDDLASAARRCADAIETASNGLKDGLWDRFKGFVREHVDVIKVVLGVLEKIALAIAIVAVVVLFIVAAPAALIAALVVAGVVVGLAIAGLRASLVAVDEATWGDVAWDLAGVALTLVGGRVTLAAGRQISTALGRAREVLTASAARSAMANLGPGTRLLMRFDGTRLSLLGRLGNFLAGRATSRAVTEVTRATTVRATLADSVRTFDRGLADQVKQLAAVRSFGNVQATAFLDGLETQVRAARAFNVANAYVATDGVVGRTSFPVLTDAVKAGVNSGAEQLDRLNWRIANLR